MYIYHHWHGLKHKHKRLVVGLGNFDGVHIGHQKLISEIVNLAKELDGIPAVFTFHPHPLAVLYPNNCPPFLLDQETKQKFIAKLNIDVLLLIPFDLDFAKLSPRDFISTILYEELGANGVVVGYNYTFGHYGQGTPELLEKQAAKHNYHLRIVPPVMVENQVVSSTKIRELLIKGQVAEAARFLGYHPFVEGQVVTGAQRGGSLGFPTANLNIEQTTLVPASGVYSAKVRIDEETYLGVANIGTKPTFQDSGKNIEVHLIDFCQNLYGKMIKIEFTQRLREEKKFMSPNDLIRQIEQDIIKARNMVSAGEVIK